MDYTTRLLPDGYIAIIDSEHNQVHSLPPVGALVWELCDGKHTITEIAEDISQSVEVVRQRNFVQEVSDLIAILTERGLVKSLDDREKRAVDS
jgi:hypothetical protein